MVQKATKGADAWVERLSKMDLPVLSGVVKELNELTEGDDSSANQLADVILKDASLTSQVLRIANSVHYNPQADTKVSTISRAVVQVGFSGVRAICISVMVIDSLLGDKPKEEMLKCMARGFHAGVQARNLVAKMDPDLKEDAFIAALLMHLGDMAFWSRGGRQADLFNRAMQRHDVETDVIAHKLIGTSFKAISLGLSKQWGLGETLTEAIANPSSKKPAVGCAVLGEEISYTAEYGWDSPEFGETLACISEFTGRPIAEVRETVLASADEAAAVATAFGAPQVCHLIPSSSGPAPHISFDRGLEPDPQLQLDILRELATMVSQGTDMNTLLQTVLEGLHRGVGLERVAILLVNQKTGELSTKYLLGDDTENWREDFHFSAQRADDNVFACAFHKHEYLVIKGRKDPSKRSLLPMDCLKLISKGTSLIAPLYAGERNIGIFYADKGEGDAVMDDEQIDNFTYFAEQANTGLSKLVRGR